MKLISWNVNGLRACLGKGFQAYFDQTGADAFCIQETKMMQGQAEFAPDGYEQYWNSAEKKGYSGTAVFTRMHPLNVTYGIGVDEHDHEGRVITLEFPKFYLVTVYTPNSQRELTRLAYRMTWEDAFADYLCRLDEQKPVVVCGDMNVAHKEIDLKNPKTNVHNAGFTQEERDKMSALLERGFWTASASCTRRTGPLQLVELHDEKPGAEHRVAHRLLSGKQPHRGKYRGGGDRRSDSGQRSLPR